MNRRDFLKGGIAAGLVSAPAWSDVLRLREVGQFAAADRLHRHWRRRQRAAGRLTPSYLQVVAIADIRPFNVHRAFHGDHSSPGALTNRCGLMTKYGWKSEDEARKHVKVYTDDYHDLLANPDVEAVVIALPLHLHAPVAIEAMKAGKHVLTEKLMAHSVHECKEMARAAEQTGKILAVGHQRHYSILYDNAVDTIRRGAIGDIHHIRASGTAATCRATTVGSRRCPTTRSWSSNSMRPARA